MSLSVHPTLEDLEWLISENIMLAEEVLRLELQNKELMEKLKEYVDCRGERTNPNKWFY